MTTTARWQGTCHGVAHHGHALFDDGVGVAELEHPLEGHDGVLSRLGLFQVTGHKVIVDRGDAGNKLLPETVAKLAKDVDVIMGAKDSSGDLDNLKAYIDLTRDVGKDFAVLAGPLPDPQRPPGFPPSPSC